MELLEVGELAVGSRAQLPNCDCVIVVLAKDEQKRNVLVKFERACGRGANAVGNRRDLGWNIPLRYDPIADVVGF